MGKFNFCSTLESREKRECLAQRIFPHRFTVLYQEMLTFPGVENVHI